MKHNFDSEMDLWLRRHARRKTPAAPASLDPSGNGETAREASSDVHLDADELNAYAEGALPPAARARYVAHLADCDACRKVATDLTLAANVEIEERGRDASQAASTARSWREWIAALLAPPVLRYAVPSLAMLAIIAIAFVALRDRSAREDATLVAKNEQTQTRASAPVGQEGLESTQASADEPARNGSPPPSSKATASTEAEYAARAGATDADLAKGARTDAISPPQSQTTLTQTANETGVQIERADGSAGRSREEEAKSVVQLAPSGAEPAEINDAGRKDKKSDAKEVLAQDRQAEVTNNRAENAGVTAPQNTAASEDRDSAARPAAPPADRERLARRRSIAGLKSEGRSRANDDGSAETRSVGGRQFRRQGSAWVDTAYNSSRSTINMARGSEQYRALVADEPALRSIAEQLSGEIIVVWKGKAYRIY